MAVRPIAHLSIDDRRARGKQARDRIPLASHAGWSPAGDRPDPVALLEEQNTTREADLVPVRHGRMLVSPFTFYRGAAKQDRPQRTTLENPRRRPTVGRSQPHGPPDPEG